MDGATTGRPGLLWVWRDQPSRFGAGSLQRAAHLLLALADHFDLHVVIVSVGSGPAVVVQDADLFRRFASFEQIATKDLGAGPDPVAAITGRHAELGAEDVFARLVAIRRERHVAATMIVTFELAVFLRPVLSDLQPTYLELDELMSRRQQRFLATPGLSPEKSDEFRRGLRLMGILERQVLPQFRGVIVSSPVERANLRGMVPDEAVSFVPNATHHEAALPKVSPGTPPTIMFVGRLDYFPNLDAARFFLAEVWPLLRSRHGDGIRFHIVGAGAPPSFEPEAVPGVMFDRNRADIVPVYRAATLAVVPVRAGGGTRVKIIEAFALGRPVVSTTMGAEGLDVEHGRHLLIADQPEAFAVACTELLDDPQKAERVATEAAAWVQKHNSTAAVRAAIADSVIVRGLRV